MKKYSKIDNYYRNALIIKITSLILILSLVAVLIWLVHGRQRNIINVVVQGNSMYPTLYSQEKVKAHRQSGTIKRGDIIIFKSPVANKILVKRVVALPGETLKIQKGKIYVNSKYLNEPYVKGANALGDKENFFIPKNSYYVMGDNRNISYDSRYFGAIKKETIIGVVDTKNK